MEDSNETAYSKFVDGLDIDLDLCSNALEDVPVVGSDVKYDFNMVAEPDKASEGKGAPKVNQEFRLQMKMLMDKMFAGDS
eukprot:3485937-Karenia_brevis.AAC.1